MEAPACQEPKTAEVLARWRWSDPTGSGKSALFDALMEAAGAPVKRPADPRNRPSTTELRLGHCQYLGDSWSILDCPGSIEFAHEVAAALSVVDLAVVVCDPAPTRALAVSPLLKQLADLGVPHMVFVNKIETLEGSVADTLSALQAHAEVRHWSCARCRSATARQSPATSTWSASAPIAIARVSRPS